MIQFFPAELERCKYSSLGCALQVPSNIYRQELLNLEQARRGLTYACHGFVLRSFLPLHIEAR
jgi:hypothetical protein